jgi:hypothetical protein
LANTRHFLQKSNPMRRDSEEPGNAGALLTSRFSGQSLSKLRNSCHSAGVRPSLKVKT